MKLFTFSLLIITVVFTLGCGDETFNAVLDNLDRPTSDVAGEIAECYVHLATNLISYNLTFDRLCIDMLVSGKTLEELAVDTTITEILADTDTYNGEYVEVQAYVIFKTEDTVVIADTNNDLTEDYLIIIEADTEYLESLAQGSQYTFIVQFFVAETANGGLLHAEPVAVEQENNDL